MWNSIVDKDVIQLLKGITAKYVSWFYIKALDDIEETRKDRMQNEELITIFHICVIIMLKRVILLRFLDFILVWRNLLVDSKRSII